MKEAFDKGIRERVNVKFTAKGDFYIDYTCELLNQESVHVVKNSDDIGDVQHIDLVDHTWNRIEQVKRVGIERGYKFAGDVIPKEVNGNE